MHSHPLSDFENKRKHTRFVRDDIKASIAQSNFFGLTEKVACKLVDISSAGVQISTKENLPIRKKTTLFLNFDNGHQFKIKARIMRQHRTIHYLSNHTFMVSYEFLNNKDNPLASIFLFNQQQEIQAKFRFLNADCIQVLTNKALDKKIEYHLVFTLDNGKATKVVSQMDRHKQQKIYSYGLKFKAISDRLGDHLLTTQTDLIFK